jgi:hypothetical protein
VLESILNSNIMGEEEEEEEGEVVEERKKGGRRRRGRIPIYTGDKLIYSTEEPEQASHAYTHRLANVLKNCFFF